MKIITHTQPRQLLYREELTKEEKKTFEELKAATEPLCKLIKEVLDDKVEKALHGGGSDARPLRRNLRRLQALSTRGQTTSSACKNFNMHEIFKIEGH